MMSTTLNFPAHTMRYAQNLEQKLMGKNIRLFQGISMVVLSVNICSFIIFFSLFLDCLPSYSGAFRRPVRHLKCLWYSINLRLY